MKLKTRQITITAIMLALCIVSQFFKNLSVYLTGPIINAALILTAIYAVVLLRNKFGKTAGLPVSIAIGAVLKALFMGILISLIILPNMLPANMLPKMHVLQLQFSVTQLITALIGGVYAIIIFAVLRKTSLGEQA